MTTRFASGVEDDYLAVAEVCDEHQVSSRVEARVVQAGCTAAEGNIGEHLQRQVGVNLRWPIRPGGFCTTAQ